MPRPLYATAEAKYTGGESHAGLWYDKFCDKWSDGKGGTPRWSMAAHEKATNPKHCWIQSIKGDVGHAALVKESALRQTLLVSARRGRFGVFTSESRFVTGTGRSHPVENGFVWHPTLGTPYLPGSSIKGMIRAWAEETGKPAERIAAALGPDRRADAADRDRSDDEDSPRAATGRVVVFDAIPTKPPRVEPEVLTPHYANWDAEHPPGDWRSPVPIPFLVVAAGTELLFSIAIASRHIEAGTDPVSNAGGDDSDAALLREVWGWLGSALAERGAGAKTAVGYGRFAVSEASTRKLQKPIDDRAADIRRAAERETPEGRWRLALEGKSEAAVLDLVRVHLDAAPIADVLDRRLFALAVLTCPFARDWHRGNAASRVGHGRDRIKALYRLLDAARKAES